MINRTEYYIYKSYNKEFESSIKELILPLCSKSVRVSIFIHAVNNDDYISKKSICKRVLSETFGSNMPTWSVIAQKPLDCEVVIEVHKVLDGSIEYKNGYVVVTSSAMKEIIISGACGDVNDNIYDQSCSSFEKIQQIFDAEGMTLNNIVRQWNYIERIVHIEKDRQHYQDLNDARSSYYKKVNWTDGYPAATGIGMQFGGIIIDLNAIQLKDDSVNIKPINNNLQIAAHAYSKGLLLGEKTLKSTPKFERAKAVSSKDATTVYISGTAAIRGEQSLIGVGMKEQTKITMENIENLICDQTLEESFIKIGDKLNLRILRVYIKDEVNLSIATEFMQSNYANIPTSYLLADVCRTELIIEIEGVANNN